MIPPTSKRVESQSACSPLKLGTANRERHVHFQAAAIVTVLSFYPSSLTQCRNASVRVIATSSDNHIQVHGYQHTKWGFPSQQQLPKNLCSHERQKNNIQEFIQPVCARKYLNKLLKFSSYTVLHTDLEVRERGNGVCGWFYYWIEVEVIRTKIIAYTSTIRRSLLKWNGHNCDVSMHDGIGFYICHVTATFWQRK